MLYPFNYEDTALIISVQPKKARLSASRHRKRRVKKQESTISLLFASTDGATLLYVAQLPMRTGLLAGG